MVNKKIFMTGASGFIGSHLLKLLLEKGYIIVAPTRASGNHNKLVHRNFIWLNNCSLNQIKTEFLENCESVIHLASHCPNAPYDKLENYIKINWLYTLNFFQKCASLVIDKFLIAGSAFEYGKSFNDFRFISPSAPLIPVGAYPTSKVMSFYMIKEFSRVNNINLSYQRIFQVYGDGEN